MERNQEDRDGRKCSYREDIAVDFLGEHIFCLYELTFAKNNYVQKQL